MIYIKESFTFNSSFMRRKTKEVDWRTLWTNQQSDEAPASYTRWRGHHWCFRDQTRKTGTSSYILRDNYWIQANKLTHLGTLKNNSNFHNLLACSCVCSSQAPFCTNEYRSSVQTPQFGEKKAARPFPNLVNVNAYQTGMRIAPDPNSTQSILQSLNTHTHSPKKKKEKHFSLQTYKTKVFNNKIKYFALRNSI